MNRWIVAVVVKTELRGVALREKILNVDVAYIHLLLARRERVEFAVCVFFEKVEVSEVVVDPIGPQISEQSHSWLLLGKNKAAKVAVELLNPSADGDKIEVRAKIVQFQLDKAFLQGRMGIEAVRAIAHIYIDQTAFARLEKIQVECGREARSKIGRTEAAISVRQIER